MFDFIPLASYSPIYYNIMLLVAFLLLLSCYTSDLRATVAIGFLKVLGFFLLLFIILYMGQRQLSGRFFGDTGTYANVYNQAQLGVEIDVERDAIFNYLMLFCTKFMSVHGFFTVVAAIYTIPLYIFSRKFFGTYWFFGFFMFIASFSFWGYGVNGIRNGMATAIFILGMCYYNRIWIMVPLVWLATGIHNSMYIPAASLSIAYFVRKPNIYFAIWLAAIPLSLIGGGFWETLFSGVYSSDERTSAYLTGGKEYASNFSSTGFRWDFVLYSASAVYAGYYFIVKKKIEDRFYYLLLGTYIIGNAFWIMVIRATFSNRFAYLSWFLLPAVIAYPMFRYKVWEDQFKYIGVIIFVYYLFTYFMFIKG